MPRPIKPKSKLRNKRPIVGLKQRVKPKSIYKKGVGRMTPVDFNKDYDIEESNIKLNCMREIRRMAQEVMREKGLTERDMRRTLGIKRYEK